MIEVMVDLHKYVPSKSVSQTCIVDNTEHTIEDKCLYPLLFGGDQFSPKITSHEKIWLYGKYNKGKYSLLLITMYIAFYYLNFYTVYFMVYVL